MGIACSAAVSLVSPSSSSGRRPGRSTASRAQLVKMPCALSSVHRAPTARQRSRSRGGVTTAKAIQRVKDSLSIPHNLDLLLFTDVPTTVLLQILFSERIQGLTACITAAQLLIFCLSIKTLIFATCALSFFMPIESYRDLQS